jgi:hypothetical protein
MFQKNFALSKPMILPLNRAVEGVHLCTLQMKNVRRNIVNKRYATITVRKH